MKRLALFAAAFALAGCLNFDEAYQQYLDQHDAGVTGGGDGATGGGAATTGGGAATTGGGAGITGGGAATTGGGDGTMGGGSTTGGGSATGGGAATGGGSATGGGVADAGCPDFLCPVLDWTSPRSSDSVPVSAGVLSDSLDNFMLYASFETSGYKQYEYRFINSPTPIEVDRTATNDYRTEGVQMRGVSMDDYWQVYRTYATHYVNGNDTWVGPAELPDGGASDPYLYAVWPVSATEAWFVGWPNAIQHWTALDDGGTRFVATVDPEAWPAFNINDVYVTPLGEVYAVGADRDYGTGYIVRETGAVVTAPIVEDSYYFAGAFNSIDGTGTQVYALHRSNPAAHGAIYARNAQGEFELAYEANFRLSRLDVEPSGEVWAVGTNGARVVYFDGGTWGTYNLPTTQFRTSVHWENINALPDGIILSGYDVLPDGGLAAVVNTYRRAGK